MSGIYIQITKSTIYFQNNHHMLLLTGCILLSDIKVQLATVVQLFY